MLEGSSLKQKDNLVMTRRSNESMYAEKPIGLRQSFTASNVSIYQDNELTSILGRKGSGSMIELDKENLFNGNHQYIPTSSKISSTKNVNNFENTFGKFTTLENKSKNLETLNRFVTNTSQSRSSLNTNNHQRYFRFAQNII